jgi:hypothetical protein
MCFFKTFSLFPHQGPIFCYLYGHFRILLSHPHTSFCHIVFSNHTCPFATSHSLATRVFLPCRVF